jgi:hypothetical protein
MIGATAVAKQPESTILGCRGGKKASRVKGASSGIVCSVDQVSFHRFCLGKLIRMFLRFNRRYRQRGGQAAATNPTI